MYERRASSIYKTLSADGHEAGADQLSRPRKAFMALCAALLLLSAPLLWANAALAGGDPPSAVLSKSGEDNSGHGNGDDDDDDNSGPGSGGDDTSKDTGDSVTTTNSANTGPGTNTNSNTDTNGDRTKGENTRHDNTAGNTGDGRDQATGRETKGQNTDKPGMNTGVSTRGETDGNDKTGKTERR